MGDTSGGSNDTWVVNYSRMVQTGNKNVWKKGKSKLTAKISEGTLLIETNDHRFLEKAPIGDITVTVHFDVVQIYYTEQGTNQKRQFVVKFSSQQQTLDFKQKLDYYLLPSAGSVTTTNWLDYICDSQTTQSESNSQLTQSLMEYETPALQPQMQQLPNESDENLKNAIKHYLNDPSFPDYVLQVERLMKDTPEAASLL